MVNYGVWMDIFAPKEDQTVPHTPDPEDPYFPMILEPPLTIQ